MSTNAELAVIREDSYERYRTEAHGSLLRCCHMLNDEQQAEFDRHLSAYAHRFGIVAIARARQINGNLVIELTAAAWRNRRLHAHTYVIATLEIDRRMTLAEQFIDHVNTMFSIPPSSG